MDIPSNWTCPVCGQAREDVTYMTPCQHRLCYGCAVWWAEKKPICAVCGHKIISIRYSVRADDDYLECSVPQPAERSDDGLQDEQGPAEQVLIPPEHDFPAEVWAAFFDQHPEDLAPLLNWLQQEIREMSSEDWWEVQAGLWATVSLLCQHGLDQETLVRELQPITDGDVLPFVQRLINVARGLYSPQIRRQLDQQDGRDAGGREASPAATPSLPSGASHQDPPASGTEEPLSSSTGEPGLPSTATATAAEEPQEEPGQAAAAGPSTGSREHSSGGPRRAPKRKTRSDPQDSPPPRKRRPRRRR
ncbi:uncharacterized protein LOC116235603 [Phasianus colchicus]|uniref:uncharacterized protein LOC116235603 n=1 Tax=Phasianus colchicus TaxID=9054 RepID=UPI00129E6E30|nr:uncharacterized protein LOC116235603 [Phasianus colchicus]XP_031459691.1 uncharacterized protein LOC116235603 [Phasianus colchicus]